MKGYALAEHTLLELEAAITRDSPGIVCERFADLKLFSDHVPNLGGELLPDEPIVCFRLGAYSPKA